MFNYNNQFKSYFFLSIIIILCLQPRFSLTCTVLEKIKSATNGPFVNQSDNYFNFANYALSLLVAAYPIYRGLGGINAAFFSDNSSELYSLFDLQRIKTIKYENSVFIDAAHLYTMVQQEMKRLKISKKERLKIHFGFVEKSKFTPTFASDSCIYFLPEFFKQTREEQQFNIKHELIHIKERHNLIKAVTALSAPFVSFAASQVYYYLLLKFNNNQPLPLTNKVVLSCACASLTYSLTASMLGFLSYYLEKRADLKLNSLKTNIGGVLAFNPYEINNVARTFDYLHKINDASTKIFPPKKKEFYVPSRKTIENFLEEIFLINRHPTHHERFAYLSKRLIEAERNERIKKLE